MTQNTRNIISSDVEIKGTVSFDNDLIADGKIEGEILSSGRLTIGHNGIVLGDIVAGHVAVYGQVKGNITAEVRCELKNEAELVGDLKAPRVVIDDGATFVGRSTVTGNAAALTDAAEFDEAAE